MSIGVSIVEDDAPVREILTKWISGAAGFSFVSTYGNADAAVARLPQDKPDVVLMDINLAGHSGIHCVQHLKRLLPKTQFLMLTVYEDADHIFDALAAGANGYLLKRTPREELLAAIKEVYEGGSPMTSYIARKVVQAFRRSDQDTTSSDVLAPREWEVLRLLARGFAYKEIADSLKISKATVNTYITRIYEKLHVHSRGEAVARYTSFPTNREPVAPRAAT
jgi:DNA-binding NarL/FixJ family response regulator